MPYESSYDAGLKPFNHDKTREKWSRKSDFIFACVGQTFKIDTIFTVDSYLSLSAGISGIFMYFVVTATFVMPLIFLQSFLGQFSSTGFISVFRIAPLFKGVGLVSLFVNLVSLTTYSIFVATPLFFFFNTLRPTIPWSCEGIKSWLKLEQNHTTPCEKNVNLTGFAIMDIPSIEFLKYHIDSIDFRHDITLSGSFSWSLLMCTVIIWMLVAFLMTRNLDLISKFLRYSCITVCALIGLFTLRLAFLPGATSYVSTLLKPSLSDLKRSIFSMPVVAMSTFGPGWGSTITMASFNKFRTNIFDSSWIICVSHFGVMVGLGLITAFVGDFFIREDPDNLFFQHAHSRWIELLWVPSALEFVELTRIMTLLFLGMVIAGILNLMVVQLISVLTSVFDEFPQLRPFKIEVTLGTIGGLALVSIYSCSNHGIHFFTVLSEYSLVTQTLFNGLLLVVVLWIYGREKFQRDVQFMTERVYPTWMVNLVRFVAPLILIYLLFGGMKIAMRACFTDCRKTGWVPASLLIIAITPWILVPGYCVYELLQSNGPWMVRCRQALRPTDWYPADPEDKQRYDKLFNPTTETIHQLTTNME